jgi:hypothetical protein
MVVFRDDLDTFCKYVAHRPPNIDRTVHQHLEDRHLETGMRGLYYVARYDHQSEGGDVITVGLDQFCGRVDLDDEAGDEAATARQKTDAVDLAVSEAAAQAGGTVTKGPVRYTGELGPLSG